jgi:protein-S-isoprenylcysteine O-methyltransferase Ste14
LLYAIGFVGNFWGALGLHGALFRSMDAVASRGGGSPGHALLVDAALLLCFALQHSGMARAGFKQRWTRIVPQALERSSYVLAASGCLALLFWGWEPLGTGVLWQVTDPRGIHALIALSFLGWGTLIAATFMIDHFELFGVRQVIYALRDRSLPDHRLVTPGLYRAVRHPIYLGFLIAFWATPLMTVGHLAFALGTTAYILLAIPLEERDLVNKYGQAYLSYRKRVRMLLPLPRLGRAKLTGPSQQN